MRLMILYIFTLLFFCNSYGQLNTDSLFESSVNNARLKNYSQAVTEAQMVLATHPDRADVMIHIANVYSWQQKFDSAKIYIERAYNLAPQNYDLYISWLNILLWNQEYEEIHRVAAIALSNNYNDKYNIALKKLIAYKEESKYSEGLAYAKTLDEETLNFTQIKAIYSELYARSKQKQLSAFYSLDFFDKNGSQPQHLAYIDFAFMIKKHTLILRSNYAHRFSKDDVQFEADYYHILKNSRFMYFNYGAGFKHNLFPMHRAGVEYYFPFTKTLDASLGARFLMFKNTSVYMATGHLGKYFGHSWLAIRPFYVFQNNGDAFTVLANYRYYLQNPINFWGFEAAYGNSPDERYVVSNIEDVFTLHAYKIKAERNIALSKSNELKLSLGYAYEEQQKGVFRNRYIFEVIFKQRF